MANPVSPLVPVAIHGWSPSTYGIWGILLIQVVVGTFFVLRRGPEWIAQWSAAKKLGADSEREDRAAEAAMVAAAHAAAAAERARIDTRMSTMEDRIERQGHAMMFIMNAAITATNALEQVSPDHVAIHQSRESLAMAASALGNEDPFSKALAKLAVVPDHSRVSTAADPAE